MKKIVLIALMCMTLPLMCMQQREKKFYAYMDATFPKVKPQEYININKLSDAHTKFKKTFNFLLNDPSSNQDFNRLLQRFDNFFKMQKPEYRYLLTYKLHKINNKRAETTIGVAAAIIAYLTFISKMILMPSRNSTLLVGIITLSFLLCNMFEKTQTGLILMDTLSTKTVRALTYPIEFPVGRNRIDLEKYFEEELNNGHQLTV